MTQGASSEAKFSLADNRAYWEDPSTVSLLDSNLRELEVEFVSSYLAAGQAIADIGCGDGVSTRRFARLVTSCLGIERSEYLRGKALEELARDPIPGLSYVGGDILDLDAYRGSFDVVVTERVLINLPSWELQRQAIDNVRDALAPGGLYVLVENTEDGDRALNAYRASVGLPPIPQHWHNLFLDWKRFADYVDADWEIVERRGFSLYYVLTRVYAQMFSSFTGFGASAQADPVFAQVDPAARALQTAIGEDVAFGDYAVVGPIQGIALRRR